MNCIIIDDDLIQRHLFSEFIDQTDGIHLLAEFSSAQEALKFLNEESVDVIFLDIEMPGMTGVEFLEEFRPKSKIILISGEEKYAIDGFNLEVSDYLLKPVSFARFSRSVDRILSEERSNDEEAKKNDFLFIKDKGVYQKIRISEILYIQSSSEYVTIHTPQRRIMLYSSMDGILKKLPSNFKRIHRSFIVNINSIEKVNGNSVEVNKQSISVSKTYQDELFNNLGIKMK